MKPGERWYKESIVTACTFIKGAGLVDKCPFYEPNLRRLSFCGWYEKEIRNPDRRQEFCEIVLIRVEGIRKCIKK